MKIRIYYLCLAALFPALAECGANRDVTFAQVNVKNNNSGVLLCGIGGLPSYTHESHTQYLNGVKFSLPYLKSPVGEHYGDDDPMGSGALSPYFGYYANASGKNLAMFSFDGEFIDGSYNSGTSDGKRYNPYNIDYYYFDTNESMRNLIRVSAAPAYIVSPSRYEKDADGSDHLNPYSKDVFTSENLLNIPFEELEPDSGWYDNGYSSWGNQWFTHQYINNGAMFSHAFIFLSNSASDHQDKFNKEDAMGVACLVYDSQDSASIRAPYGSGLLGYLKIRFKINDANNEAYVTKESSPGITLSTLLNSQNKNVNSKVNLESAETDSNSLVLMSSNGGDGGQLPTVLRYTYSVNYSLGE